MSVEMTTQKVTVKDVADREFLMLPWNASCLDAAKRMKSKEQGFVVVTAPSGSLVGMITEWDLVSKVIAEEKDPANTKIGNIMTMNLVTVDADATLDEVADLMTKKQIRRALVMWEDQLYGAITARTILAKMKTRQ